VRVGYCSRGCQTGDWADHKWTCSVAVEIRPSGVGEGLGVFALRAFEVGEEIVREKPAVRVVGKDLAGAWEGAGGAERRVVLGFTDAWCARGGAPTVAGIVATNSIPMGDGGAGVFAIACRINHACYPNARWLWREDVGRELVLALRPIRAGEEITVCYAGELNLCSTAERRAHLRENLRFECACTLCSAALPESDARLCSIRDLHRSVHELYRTDPGRAIESLQQILATLEAEGRSTPLDSREVHHNMSRILHTMGRQDDALHFAILALKDTRLTDGKGSPKAAALEYEIRRLYRLDDTQVL